MESRADSGSNNMFTQHDGITDSMLVSVVQQVFDENKLKQLCGKLDAETDHVPLMLRPEANAETIFAPASARETDKANAVVMADMRKEMAQLRSSLATTFSSTVRRRLYVMRRIILALQRECVARKRHAFERREKLCKMLTGTPVASTRLAEVGMRAGLNTALILLRTCSVVDDRLLVTVLNQLLGAFAMVRVSVLVLVRVCLSVSVNVM